MKDQILELIENEKIDISRFTESYDLYEDLDYYGQIHDIIDGNIDIYYYDLRKWAVDNYDYIEDAINGGLVNTDDFDYHSAIQSGQYLKNQQEACELVEEIFNEYNAKKKAV